MSRPLPRERETFESEEHRLIILEGAEKYRRELGQMYYEREPWDHMARIEFEYINLYNQDGLYTEQEYFAALRELKERVERLKGNNEPHPIRP